MPVLIDLEFSSASPLRGCGEQRESALETSEAAHITIGLINNMPDSALISTERQVFGLLNAAAGKIPVGSLTALYPADGSSG